MTSDSQPPESDTQAGLRVTDETLNRQPHEGISVGIQDILG